MQTVPNEGVTPPSIDDVIENTLAAIEAICRDWKIESHGVLRAFDQWPEPELVDAQAAEKILNLGRTSSRAAWQTADALGQFAGTLRELLGIKQK